MYSPYIPSRDANALLWMQAFSSGISADPATFELTEADADAIALAVQEFQEALAVATNEATRTKGTVNAKDTKRNAAEELCRSYAVQIKYNEGITDQAKIDIGVRPVLVAEGGDSPSLSGRGRGGGSSGDESLDAACEDERTTHPPTPSLKGGGDGGTGTPLGYIIAKDQYMKRDDVGIVYQLNVMPMKQRHLIGATLVQAAFDRAAYGCKLYCCWCAQDIQANWFWESIGFVPLAFRTGSRAKQRIHIFWQRRVRDDDAGPGATPYWFPHQTQGGAVAEDRIVLPIPPGTHWRDAKPLVLPSVDASDPRLSGSGSAKHLPGGSSVKSRPDVVVESREERAKKVAVIRSQSAHLKGVPKGKAAVVTAGGVKHVGRGDSVPEDEPAKAEQAQAKKKRTTKKRGKSDPKLVKAARELRDRYLECVNEHACAQLPPGAMGRYDVSKALGRPGAAGPGDSRRSDAVDAGRTLPRSSVSDDRLLDAA